MKLTVFIVICFLISFFSLTEGGTNHEAGELFFFKTLSKELKIEVYKTKQLKIVPNSVKQNFGDNVVTGEYYIDKYLVYKVENLSKSLLLYIEDYFHRFPQELKTFLILDVIYISSKYFLLYQNMSQICIKTVFENDNNMTYTREITQDIGFKLKVGKIFKTKSGLFASLEYYNNVKELWLVSTESPILLWSNKGNKKGREHEFRKEDRIKAALLEYERKKAEDAANLEKNKTNNVNDKKGNMDLNNKSADSKDDSMLGNFNLGSADNVHSDRNKNARNDPDNLDSKSKSTYSRSNSHDKKKKTSEGSDHSKKEQNQDETDSTTIIWIAICVFAGLLISVIIFRRK